jgi:diguanylate cyclase (GGDEF)-like protein
MQIDRLKTTVNELYKANKELKEKEKEIYTLAYYDNLTGVANRALLYEFADKFIETAKRNKSKVGLMFLDVDKFKSINDIYGHETGDLVLKQIAKILSEAIRKNDVLARYGGDEFLILLPDIKNVNNHENIISRINNNENRFVHLEDTTLELSLSIGTSFYPDDGETIDKLIAVADRRMYIDKKNEN